MSRSTVARALVCLLILTSVPFASAVAAGRYSEDFSDAQAQGWSASGSTFSFVSGDYRNDTAPASVISVYDNDTWNTDFVYHARVFSDFGASGNAVGVVYNYQDSNNYYQVWLNALGTIVLNKIVSGLPPVAVRTSTYKGANHDVWIDIEVIRRGTLTTVRVNGATVFLNVAQTEFGAGKIGVFAVWNLGRYDNISVEPIAPHYYEDFTDNQAQGWSTVGSTYTATIGLYKNDDLNAAKTLSVYDGNTWNTNFIYNVRLESELAGNPWVHLVSAIYNYQDSNNYYAVTFDAMGSAKMQRVTAGVTSVVASATYHEPIWEAAGNTDAADEQFNVRIERVGSNTTVRVNGTAIFTDVAQTEYGAGKIGVGTSFNTGKFDTVSVMPTGGSEQSGPEYPRRGTVRIGGAFNYDSTTVQAELSRAHIAILGYWKGWNNGRAMTMNQSIANIKAGSVDAANPTKVFLYVNNGEFSDNPNLSTVEVTDKLDAMDWWLKNSAGQRVVSPYGAGSYYLTNTTSFAPLDGGWDWTEWYANWLKTNFDTPNPLIDGFFTDNVYPYVRKDGDWNRDGTQDLQSNPTVATWFRQAFRKHYNVLDNILPVGKRQIGNIGAMAEPGVVIEPEYIGMVDGGTFEKAFTVANGGGHEQFGWAQMMARYRRLLDVVDGEKLLILMQTGSLTDYQRMRYGLGSTLLDNGYYSFSLNDDKYDSTPWFDEYDIKLGYPITPPPTSAWQLGVYRRDFQNGIVLVNPRGNGARTVTLGSGFKRHSGTQDSITNSGANAPTVTLQEQDAIILLYKPHWSS
jgi:hypothetical protein